VALNIVDFPSLTATNANAIRLGDPAAVEALAGWSGVGIERLASYDMGTTQRGVAWKLGKAQMSRDMAAGYRHRYCPKCILGDLEKGGGRVSTRPYERVIWLTRGYQSCVHHACPIVEVQTDRFGHGDLARLVENNMAAIEQEAATAASVNAMKVDEYVTARVAGEPSNTFLDGLETYVAVDLCLRIGRFDREHQSRPHVRSFELAMTDRERGYAIASRGAPGIEETIATAVNHERSPVRRREYVCARSLRAFDEVHISLFTLALQLGVFPGKLRGQLEQRGIKSIFEPTGRNTRFYRAEDVRDLTG
jgi:hypothetical protein